MTVFSWEHTPSATQVFMFSAITWNRHQIHFDKDQAQVEGFSSVVVQRGLIGNFFSRALMAWFPTARQQRLAWKVQQSAFPGQSLQCKGTFKSRTPELWTLELSLQGPQGVVATCSAEVKPE